MGSKDQKIALLNQHLEQLGSITNSPSVNKASIIVHASKYIEELKERIDKLNEDVSTSQPSHVDDENSLPLVTVETLEKGFLINVFSEKNCPGLLVSILEAFEELGLELSDARVSCSDSFRLEAVSETEGQIDRVDAQMVKQSVLEAIRNWSQSNEQD
ncbi:transcription factor bHLH61-like isoform X1 [Nicotiana tomentosiformis]|uniref:transcription factor bHLH61-like isoform X1 n=1 Tax=Nicotiana tomentosiformis TaxID=4098 RepID=UPI00051C3276|nr:transcription factor bHLH61-like isoform X1 [Nicotiana tomentosiformis]